MLLRFAAAVAGRDDRARARARRRSSTRISCGKSCRDDEFGFDELAREYYGATPAPAESAAVALALARAPMYFYRKGRGRYRKAPPDALKAALASVARKEREAREIAQWVAELARAPAAARRSRRSSTCCSTGPTRTRPNGRRSHAACEAARIEPACSCCTRAARSRRRTTITSGASSPRRSRTAPTFPPWGALPGVPELPLAPVRAFSIDDASTTEIDDAFSVRELGDGTREIGIHIACPALRDRRAARRSTRSRGSACRPSTCRGARSRCCPTTSSTRSRCASTRSPPALSLYVETDADGAPLRHRTALERVPIAANLRHDALTEAFAARAVGRRAAVDARAARAVAARDASCRNARQARRRAHRLQLRRRLERRRRRRAGPRDDRAAPARQSARQARRRADDPRQPHVGTPHRAMRGMPGLYRVQAGGKVKMSTRPGEHQGLGVSALPVGELAAAALQRPRQPAAAARDVVGEARRRTPTTTPSSSRRWPISRRRIRSTPRCRTGWSATGACAGCCRRRSTECTATRHPRQPRALRPAAAGRAPARHAGAARRTRACGSRSAASTFSM